MPKSIVIRRPHAIGGLLLAALIPCHAVAADNVIAVTTLSDNLDAFDQMCSLREALYNANTNTQFSPVIGECAAGAGDITDVIVLQKEGVYHLTLAGAGDDAGDLDIHANPQLEAGLEDLRIQTSTDSIFANIRQDVPDERVIENHQANVALRNIWLSTGQADKGGGIYNAGGVMRLEEISVDYSDAITHGGGVYNDGDMTVIGGQLGVNEAGDSGGSIYHASGTMRLVGVALLLSKATTGGAIYNAAVMRIESDSTLSNGNEATEFGGCIANAETGVLEIESSSIESCYAPAGGGVANAGGRLALVDVDVRNNKADTGAGLMSMSAEPIRIVRSRIVDNQATSSAAGVFLSSETAPEHPGLVSQSLIAGNTTGGVAGGIAVGGSMSVLLANTTLSGNLAPGGYAGNLAVGSDAAKVRAVHVTFASEGTTPSIANFGELSMHNSIAVSDNAETCFVDAKANPIVSLGHNLVRDITCGSFGEAGDIFAAMPLLGPLADNGGPTWTHALLDGSPAVDAADDTACATETIGGVDQRGGKRPVGAGCDIGAFEKGAVLPFFADGFE